MDCGWICFCLGSWISMVFRQMAEVAEDATSAGGALTRVGKILWLEVEMISPSRFSIFKLWQFSSILVRLRPPPFAICTQISVLLEEINFTVRTNTFDPQSSSWALSVVRFPNPHYFKSVGESALCRPGQVAAVSRRQGPVNCKLGQNQVRGF